MSTKYRFGAAHNPHFITATVVGWIDFFTRPYYKEILIESLRYCQAHKGLEVFSFCLMPSHLHMIARCQSPHVLSFVIRDFKSFTARKYHACLQDLHNTESRREWLIHHFTSKSKRDFQFWQTENHPKEIFSEDAFYQKMEYIHLNPVMEGYVNQPEDWVYSSASIINGKSKVLELSAW